jgi:hypothetical protein
MPQRGLIVRALIASPSDVTRERRAVSEVVERWNATHSVGKAVVIEPVKWESHAVPGLDGRPQGMINEQLLGRCDFLIGVFWTRLGTRTGVAESGSAEEVDEFHRAGKPVLLYFSSIPVEPASINQAQYRRLNQFRRRMREAGLIDTYSSSEEFREKLFQHLSAVIDRIVEASRRPRRRTGRRRG